MFNWRIDLSWNGKAYVGWQKQPSGPSIQAEVERCLCRIFNTDKVIVHGAGRTDAGVHALHHIASFQTETDKSVHEIVRGLNGLLPKDIACSSAQKMPLSFHARYSSGCKRYRYRIFDSPLRDPHRHGLVWRWGSPLNTQPMFEAASFFCGTHDFQAFRSSGCCANGSIRTIRSSTLHRVEDELQFEVVGNGFLRHQVRIMAGTLLEIGIGKLFADAVPEMLKSRDRNLAGQTAPAHGLWLVETQLKKEQKTGPLP